jgi:hypothetical protein
MNEQNNSYVIIIKTIICIALFLLITIGLFGNLMNLYIFSKRSMFKMSTFRLLYYLSIVDFLILTICTSDALMTFGFKLQIRSFSTFTCRFHTFLSYLLGHLSSWVLMLASIDRVFVVWNKKFNFWLFNKPNYIEKLISIVAFSLILLNTHYLIFYDLIQVDYNHAEIYYNLSYYNDETLKPIISDSLKLDFEISDQNSSDYFFLQTIKQNLNNNYQKNTEKLSHQTKNIFVCYSTNNPSYVYFLTHIWTWIDSVIYSILPILIMVVCSILIIKEVKKKSLRFIGEISTLEMNKRLNQRNIRRNYKILFMLTATNIFFLICSLPYCIIYHKSNSERTETDFTFTLIIVHILSYSNNSMNFIFYYIFSEKYREKMNSFFCSSSLSSSPSKILTNRRRTSALINSNLMNTKINYHYVDIENISNSLSFSNHKDETTNSPMINITYL